MKQHITQTETLATAAPSLAATLELEANELTAIHTGLVRHMIAWRCAQEAASARLTAVLARTDAILERIASKQH